MKTQCATGISASTLCNIYLAANCRLRSAHIDDENKEIAKLRWLNFSNFDYLSTSYREDVEYDIYSPEDVMIFYLPREGSMELELVRGQSTSADGPLAVVGLECRAMKVTAGRRHHRIAIERRHFLKSMPESVASKVVGPVTFQQQPDIGKLSHALTSLIETSFETICETKDAHDSKLFAIGDVICSTLLNFWPNNVSDGLKEEGRRIVPRQVKAAMDHIDADPFMHFTVNEIARLSGVSVRALQYGFRNFASCSVREFIFRRRVKKLKEAAFNPEHMRMLKATAGITLLRNTNRLHTKYTGRPAIPRELIELQ